MSVPGTTGGGVAIAAAKISLRQLGQSSVQAPKERLVVLMQVVAGRQAVQNIGACRDGAFASCCRSGVVWGLARRGHHHFGRGGGVTTEATGSATRTDGGKAGCGDRGNGCGGSCYFCGEGAARGTRASATAATTSRSESREALQMGLNRNAHASATRRAASAKACKQGRSGWDG
ncbi:hypothetical protein E2562_028070 [Oryza meyeriana var. granulata]|uniref:Uncharacterized protein n=1 Tax=Oryza meyeriana var. granulata TaxID=110450 RepID=A0A6G1C243_9ORYZ|nr:hypothetical protein E2562_028070 [Oryza meyeriana var. granulata]